MNLADEPTGVAFPFRFETSTGGVATTRGPTKSMDDVRILLATRLGERLMVRSYGTALPSLVHDPNDDVLVDIARDQTQQAIMRWEPRVAPAIVRAANDPDLGTATVEVELNLPADSRVISVAIGMVR